MAARLYDPPLVRFLEVDPVEGGSCSDYDYVCGDPVNGYDLDGSQLCVDARCSKTAVTKPKTSAPAKAASKSSTASPQKAAIEAFMTRATSSAPAPSLRQVANRAVDTAKDGASRVAHSFTTACGVAVGSTLLSAGGTLVSLASAPVTTAAGAAGAALGSASVAYGVNSMRTSC